MKEGFIESATGKKANNVAVNEKGELIYKIMERKEMCFSNLKRDDFEVYFRAVLFEQKVSRDLWKFYYHVKWLHFSKRFTLIKDINNSFLEGKNRN